MTARDLFCSAVASGHRRRNLLDFIDACGYIFATHFMCARFVSFRFLLTIALKSILLFRQGASRTGLQFAVQASDMRVLFPDVSGL